MPQYLTLGWRPCEVYVCGDPECGSKVLILKGPQKDPHLPALPRCVCGSILEVSGSVEGVEGSSDIEPEPNENRE